MSTRPPQIFFWKTGTNSTVDFGPNPDWTPIFSQFGSRLTTCMRLRRSLVWLELALSGDLRSLIHVVKRLRKWLKIGVQSGFGPEFTVEFEAFFQKKIGLAYCAAPKLLRTILSFLTKAHNCSFLGAHPHLLSSSQPQRWYL